MDDVKSESKAMWLAKTPDGMLVLRVYGFREAVDGALKTWWNYYHNNGTIKEEFPLWFSNVIITSE